MTLTGDCCSWSSQTPLQSKHNLKYTSSFRWLNVKALWVAEIASILISASGALIIMWNNSYKQGFHAHWALCRLLGQNLTRNTGNGIFLYSPASWPHCYVLNSFYLGFSVGKKPNRIHLRNFYWIKRMARGDKGRRAFIIVIDFYLHCTNIPMAMYWYVPVEKIRAICAMPRRTTASHVPVWNWAKETKISLCATGKGTDGAKIHTHTNSHFFMTQGY